MVPAVLAVALPATDAFATIEAVGTNSLASHTDAAWQPYVEAAKAAAVDLTTMSHQTVDRDVQRVLDSFTGTFYDDFGKRSEPYKQVVRGAKSISSGTVSGAGLESLDGTHARVLVAVSVKTTSSAKPNQESKAFRMRISEDKIDQSYKVSDVEFVS